MIIRRLNRKFNPIAIRVQDDAFVVAVPGMARAVHDVKPVLSQAIGEFVDALLRPYG